MDRLLAIDLGSTSIKAAVVAADGRCLAVGSRPTAKVHPAGHPERTEWDPEGIWAGVCGALHDALAKAGAGPAPWAVAVTGMGMDGVPVAADGTVLYPFISWHDHRTAPQADWWRGHIGAERTYAIAGFPIWAMEAAMRIRWMQEHEPSLMARAQSWLFIEDFVNFRLCGARITDPSMASCALLFDQRHRAWSDELLAAAGIARDLLPQVQPSGTIIGAVHAAAAAATGIPAGTPVVLGGQDHLCGTLASGAWQPGTLLNVMGTWDNLIVSVEEPRLTPALLASGLCQQAHVAPGLWAAWGGTVAGESLEWFRRIHATGEEWDALLAGLDDRPVGAGGVLFLPHIGGQSFPVADPHSAGAFVGITPATTRTDLLQAVIEGLDLRFADMLDALRDHLGCRIERITAVGGGSRNRWWVQDRADVAGVPVEVPTESEATLQGAAMLAGIGVGVFTDLTDATRHMRGSVTVVEPRPERTARLAGLRALHRALHPALAPIHKMLTTPSGGC